MQPPQRRRHSRTRSLAVLVCSPEVLYIDCTVEQMRLVNALGRLVEMASPTYRDLGAQSTFS